MWWCWLLLAAQVLVRAEARTYTDAEYHRLPRLYHLDNYDRCLTDADGLYCSGTFKLTADKPSSTYDLIQEYSADIWHFNHTNLYRGYCVSRRCPSNEKNSSWRFEQCMQKRISSLGLRATLQSHHCYTPGPTRPPDGPERAFFGTFVLVLFFNFLGTLYDFMTFGKGRSRLLLAWSLRANWNRLIATYEDGDKRLSALAPIQGIRCLMVLFVLVAHSTNIDVYLHTANPSTFEKILGHPLTMFIRNGSSMIQLFIVLSNFLFAYGLLIYSKEHKLRLVDLPLRIINRVVRLSPIHLGTVAYAATWWRRAGDGPQWDAMIGAESDICRRKFWLHAFYLHNLFDSDSQCLIQTWYFAVDFQLYVFASIVVLILERMKWPPIPVLTALLLMSCFLNMALAYYYNWTILLYVTTPETLRRTFRGVPSFTEYYVKPWGSLPACFTGLLLAHVHHYVQESGYQLEKNKLFMCIYKYTLLLFGWLYVGHLLQPFSTSRWFSALYVGVERPVFAIVMAIFFLGAFNNVDGFLRRVTAWRGWQVSGRLMLSVVSMHWCVNMLGVAGRRHLTDISLFSIGGESMSTLWWTYWLAILMTLMVEYPCLKTFSAIFT